MAPAVHQPPTTATLGQQLALLLFVEQELGRLETACRAPEEALTFLRSAQRDRRWLLYDALINQLTHEKRWASIRAAAQAWLRVFPGNAAAQARLGAANLHLGKRHAAFESLRQAVALGEHASATLESLALLYRERGAIPEALLTLRAACTPQQLSDSARSYEEQIAAIIERERQDIPAPRSLARLLHDTPTRLHYLLEFLQKAVTDGKITRELFDNLQHDLHARLQALTPVAEPVVEVTTAAAPVIPPAARPARPPLPPPPVPPRPCREPFNWSTFWSALLSERMLRALLYLGATLLVVSACTWVVFNWNDFSKPLQLSVLMGATALFYGAGGLLRGRLGLARSGETLVGIGAGWVAVDGWATASLDLLQLTPSQSWLLISVLCLPVYALTVWWLRKEFFGALTALAAISLVLSTLTVLHVSPAGQSCALLVLLLAFLAAARQLRTLAGGKALADPVVWIAQGLVPIILLLATLGLRSGSPLDRALLATDWWLALGFYLLSLRVFGGIGFEQAAAWVAPAALIFSAEAVGVPSAWHGALLLAVTPLYLLIAPRRAAAYAATNRPWLTYPLVWPTYSTAYLLSLLALMWPERTLTAALVSALGTMTLYLASTRIFQRPIWAWITSVAGLLACWDVLALLPTIDLQTLVFAAALIGAGYWLVGVALQRIPRYGLAPLVIGYGLLTLALLASFALGADTQLRVLPVVIVVCLASAFPGMRGAGGAGSYRTMIALPQIGLAGGFLALAVALLPGWLGLLMRGLPIEMISLSQAFLAGGYLLAGLGLRGSGQQPFRRGLTGVAVALTCVALLPISTDAVSLLLVALIAGWALALLPLWQMAGIAVTWWAGFIAPAETSTHPRIAPLDLLALLGGLAALLVPFLRAGDRPLLALTLLVCACIYVLAVRLYLRVAGLYATGGLLVAAWLVGLQWLAVPLPGWGAWAAPLALLFVAAGLLLERRRLIDGVLPCHLYGYGNGLAGLIWCIQSYGQGALGTADMAQSAVSILGLACLATISALHYRRWLFGIFAAALPAFGYLLVLGARVLPLHTYGEAFAGLAMVYIALVLLHEQGWLRGLTVFRTPLVWCGHLLSIVALLLGVVGGEPALAQICTLLAVTYALSAVVLRRPIFVTLAGLLLPVGLALYLDVYGARLLGVQASAQGLLALVLGCAYVSLGLRLRRAAVAYVAPLHLIGIALVALAPFAALSDRPMLLDVLGGLILLCVYWAWLNEHKQSLRIADLGLAIGKRRFASLPTPFFLYPVAVLTPLWVVLLADYTGLNGAWQGLALLLVALVWLALSRWLRQPDLVRPFRLASYTLPVLAPIVAFNGPIMWVDMGVLALDVGLYWVVCAMARTFSKVTAGAIAAPCVAVMLLVNLGAFHWLPMLGGSFALSEPFLPFLLFLGALVYAATAAVERRPFWSIPAALSAPAVVMLTVPVIQQPWLAAWIETSAATAWALVLFACISFGSVWLCDWWLAMRPSNPPVPADYLVPSAFCVPLYSAVALSALGAVCIQAIARVSQIWNGDLQLGSLQVLSIGVAALYILYARRFRNPLWLYAAGSMALVPHSNWLFDLFGLPSSWSGPALMLVAMATFGIGRWLHRRDWGPPDPTVPSRTGVWFDPHQGVAWALPLYVVAWSGSLVAVARSLDMPWPLAITLFGATLLYAYAAFIWRSRAWQAASLVAGHACYAALLYALGLLMARDPQALVLLPPMVVMAVTGLIAERRSGGAGVAATHPVGVRLPCVQRLLNPTGAQGLYLAAAIDMLLALALALVGTPSTLVIVVWVVAALLAVLALLWGDNVLAFSAPTLLALGGDTLLMLEGYGFGARLNMLALEGVVLWWVGQALRWRAARAGRAVGEGTATTGPLYGVLRWWGLGASVGAVGLALAVLVMLGDVLPLSQVVAVAGLLVVGEALVERRLRLSYIGSAMLVGSWMLTVLLFFPTQPQLYALPTGLYLLALGATERWLGAPRRLAQLLELLGMSVLLAVTFWQSLPSDLFYAALLGLECLLILVWGALQRVRMLFFGGIVMFLLNVAVQSVGPIQHAHKALLAFAVGLALVVAAVYVERQRDRILSRTQQFLAQLETWN